MAEERKIKAKVLRPLLKAPEDRPPPKPKPREIKPQPGPQTAFLTSCADIVIYGGAAGGGKTFGLLLEPLRNITNPKFDCVMFRRTNVQVRNPGGLWDASEGIYPYVGARGSSHALTWRFPSGATVRFGHLEHEKNKFDWQGSEIPLICFDELTHFTQGQFFYMLSRNRSTSGIPGYVRCTTNPMADHWVTELISWWLGPDGFPITNRSGVVRWFIRQNDEVIWADTRQELIDKHGPDAMPKSLTFIPARITDNQALLLSDPNYLASLKAMPRVERMQLLDGNWKVKPSSGMVFRREWFEVVQTIPCHNVSVRYWDRAATKKTDTNDPDWTAGVKLSRDQFGVFYVEDVVRFRETPAQVEKRIMNVASQDGPLCAIGLSEDPGSAGVMEANYYISQLAGYNVRSIKETGDKVTRANPSSAQAEGGNIKIKAGPWNEAFLTELENFPVEEGQGHDDQVDALSGAMRMLTENIGSIANIGPGDPRAAVVRRRKGRELEG